MKLYHRIIPGILFLVLFNKAYSQGFGYKIEPISKEVLEMPQYAKDISAEAVILYDLGRTSFIEEQGIFKILFERYSRIKIFSKAGFEYSEIEIPYYIEGGNSELITELIARTYNLTDGILSSTPLDINNTYDEKISENWWVKKFAMPNVKEGSVIECNYKIITPYLFNLRDWTFQSRVPTIYSEYIVKMVPFYEYKWLLQGTSRLDIEKSYKENALPKRLIGSNAQMEVTYNDMIYHFGMKEVPGFKDESFITTINDYIIKMDWQLSKIKYPGRSEVSVISTWENLNKELLKDSDFGRYIEASSDAAKKDPDINNLIKLNDQEKMESAVNYVKTNYNWDGKRNKFTSKNVKEFIKEKTGNCADINLFLTGILNNLGLEAYPVILSTRDHGKIYLEYPFHNFFNYVICAAKINNNYILSDATEIMCPYNNVPTRCLNWKGLVVNKNATEWIEFIPKDTSVISENITIDIIPEKDSIYGIFNITATSYDALDFRNSFHDEHEEIENNWTKKDLPSIYEIATSNYLNLSQPYVISFKTRVPIENIDSTIIISPFFNESIKENPFTQTTRIYPFDLIYPQKREFKSLINFPAGYKISQMPDNYSLDNQLITINYTIIERASQGVEVTAMYHFKKSIYTAKEYPITRFYINEIINRFNNQIVLVKNENL